MPKTDEYFEGAMKALAEESRNIEWLKVCGSI